MAYKLRSKIKKAWLKALRSGEYKQCQNTLTKDGGYCCLGVLAKVTADIEGRQYEDYRENEYAALPNRLLIETVFRDKQLTSLGVFEMPWHVKVRERKDNYTPGDTALYVLNDALEYTFDEIADVIERYF
jgi:hypothetical protein